jgi:hypothetical protein
MEKPLDGDTKIEKSSGGVGGSPWSRHSSARARGSGEVTQRPWRQAAAAEQQRAATTAGHCSERAREKKWELTSGSSRI